MVCEAVAFQRDGALPGGSASPANEGKEYSGQRPSSERAARGSPFPASNYEHSPYWTAFKALKVRNLLNLCDIHYLLVQHRRTHFIAININRGCQLIVTGNFLHTG